MRYIDIPIPAISIDRKARTTRIDITLSIDGRNYEIWYKIPYISKVLEEDITNSVICLLLIPAMQRNLIIRSKSSLSAKLLNNIDTIQDIFLSWFPDDQLKKVKIHVLKNQTQSTIAISQKKGTCFTGGVDSFYSLMKNKSTIDTLIYIHGFDIPIDNLELRNEVSQHLKYISKKTKKSLIEIETNLRQFTDDFAGWAKYYHGAAIASVMLLLSDRFTEIIIPSSNSYADLFPSGSHLILDKHWGTEKISFIHDGAESNRIQKVRFIAKYSVINEHLRVCWQSNKQYNCSKCEKCIRTMIELDLVGALINSNVFDKKLSRSSIFNLDTTDPITRLYINESYRYATQNNIKNKTAKRLNKLVSRIKI